MRLAAALLIAAALVCGGATLLRDDDVPVDPATFRLLRLDYEASS